MKIYFLVNLMRNIQLLIRPAHEGGLKITTEPVTNDLLQYTPLLHTHIPYTHTHMLSMETHGDRVVRSIGECFNIRSKTSLNGLQR